MPSWALGLLPGWRSRRRLLGAGGSSGVSPQKPLGSGAAAGALLGRGSWGIPREPPYPELSHPRAGTRGCPVGGVRLFTSASNPSPELGTAAITMFNENKVIPSGFSGNSRRMRRKRTGRTPRRTEGTRVPHQQFCPGELCSLCRVPLLGQCPALGSCWTILGQGFWEAPSDGHFWDWDVPWEAVLAGNLQTFQPRLSL